MCQALIKDTQFGSKIKALSLMLKCEWTNSPEEVNFWKANVDAVTFEIQANGVFDDDTAEWLSKNINIIWISCDGTPDIQDAHRICIDKNKKSSELIKQNINELKKAIVLLESQMKMWIDQQK